MDSLDNTTQDLLECETSPQCSAKALTTIDRKLKRTVSLNQKRKVRKLRPWKQWLAQTARIKYSLPPAKPEGSSYDLQNLFHMSSSILSPIASGHQSFNLNIFNMPNDKKVNIEEQLKSQVSNAIALEILNVTAEQQVQEKEIPKSEVIVISDSESENEDTSLENNKVLPIIDKGFYQQTCTFLPKDNHQISKIEMITMPPMQKPTTLEYLRSQTTSSVKVEVVNPAPTQSAIVEFVGKEVPPKPKEKESDIKDTTQFRKPEHNSISEEKALIPTASKICEACENTVNKRQNVMVKIYHYPTETNLMAPGSSNIKFEIITSPQEKGISTEDADIVGVIDSRQELQKAAICDNQTSTESTITSTTSTSTDSNSKTSTQLASTLTKDEAKSPNKFKIEISNFNDNPTNNQSLETDFAKENSTKTLQTNSEKKPLTFKQLAKLLKKAREIPTQTSKIQKVSVNTSISQSSTATAAAKLTASRSGYTTLRQRQMELHRLRVQVEEKRLELLDLKLAREYEEMERSKIKFEKDLKTKRMENITLDDCIDI